MKKPILALALSIASIVSARGAAVALAGESSTPLQTAVDEVRSAGVALWEWYRAAGAPLPLPAQDEASPSVDLGPASAIDATEARRRGLPAVAIARLEGLDPWGHPYEVRLGDGHRPPTLVVRSAGRNGRFEGDRYVVGSFLAGADADDLVWVDGYFVRWPERR